MAEAAAPPGRRADRHEGRPRQGPLPRPHRPRRRGFAAAARVETIDLYYAHKDDPETPLEETLEAFDRLVRAGKVRAIAASNYSADRLREALDISAREGWARYEALQPQYHLMWRAEFEGPLQDLCLDRGIAVLPFWSLASSFLTGKYRGEADTGKSIRGDRMHQYLNPRGFRVPDALDAVAAEARATPAQVALAWLASRPGVAAPIASARTPEQLEELLGAVQVELSSDQIKRLDSASKETP